MLQTTRIMRAFHTRITIYFSTMASTRSRAGLYWRRKTRNFDRTWHNNEVVEETRGRDLYRWPIPSRPRVGGTRFDLGAACLLATRWTKKAVLPKVTFYQFRYLSSYKINQHNLCVDNREKCRTFFCLSRIQFCCVVVTGYCVAQRDSLMFVQFLAYFDGIGRFGSAAFFVYRVLA